MPAVRARSLNCSQCGSPIGIRNALKAKVATCQSCDAIIDLRSPKFEVLGQARRDQRPRGLLCLGMTAERDGKRWEVIGLLVFEGSDEGETWTWDEWLLMSEDGRYAWIGHDEGKYSWQTLLTPTDPPMIETLEYKDTLSLDGKTLHVRERGRARISMLDGELTWKACPGDQISYYDLSSNYSIEVTEDEIEFYSCKPMRSQEIYEQFSMTEHLEILAEVEARRQVRKQGSRSAFGALMICMCGGGLMWTSACVESASNKTIASETTVLRDLLPGPSVISTFPLSDDLPQYNMYMTVKLFEPVDSLAVSLTSPSGVEHPMLSAELDGPGWGSSSYSSTFSVEETGDWSLKVQGTLNGTPVPAAAPGYYNPDPGTSGATLSWRLVQHRYDSGYPVLSGMCAFVCGIILFFIGMLRNVSMSGGHYSRLRAATVNHHQAVRSAGVTS